PGSPGQAPAAKPLLENPDVQVWVHDLNVEPGKVYRYRVKLAVSNPFFGRGSALLPDQQDLAKNALLYGQPSEWSEPVRVLDDQYYFITSAAEADATGAARATAEVFKF